MARIGGIPRREYRSRIRAWSMYDWANSAFAVVVLAAVLPTYFVEVAGTSLPNPDTASSTYALVVAGSLALVALLAPVLGALSDLVRAKKLLLSVFVTIGVAGTSLLFLVNTGDWVAAAIFFVIGRFGFGMANVFYDALLPHTAIESDLDRVSTRGYAMGYLGGGLVLAIAVALILFLPDDNLGVRISFLLVGVWWAISSIPILRRLPEPPAAAAKMGRTRSVVRLAFTRLATTFRNFRRYRQLGRFLVAFLLYDTAIGTVIALAVVYGADLGFGVLELVAALLLVQFAGIPFTLLFGALARRDSRRRGAVLGFLAIVAISLPLIGIAAAYTAGGDLVGREGPAFVATDTSLGEGEYVAATSGAVIADGQFTTLAKSDLPRGARSDYLATPVPGSTIEIPFNGERIKVKHSEAADHGRWAVAIDDVPLLDDGEPLVIDAYRPTVRFEVPQTFEADGAGEHILTLTLLPGSNPDAIGTVMAIGEFEVLPPQRIASLPLILGTLAAIVLVAGIVGLAISEPMGRLADRLETKGAIMFSLAIYTGIAAWGFFLDTVIEFWFLALAVAIVQGGSQALSRSLYAAMAPASQSGEFFGFFTAIARLTAIIGPLLFAGAVTVFGSSRPAVASLAVLFIGGALLLRRVDVAEGKEVAREHDASALSYPRHVAGGLANYGRPVAEAASTSSR